MGLHDAAYHIGVESTFNSKVTATRSYEVKTLDPKIESQILKRGGMRKAAQAQRHAKTLILGTEHSVAMDVPKKGLGLLMQALVASTAGPTQVAATTAYTQAHTWGVAGPTTSLTCQQAIQYPVTSGKVFTHAGCMATGWKINQSADDLLQLEVDLLGASVDIVTAEASAAYVASMGEYAWDAAVVTIDSVAFDDVIDLEFAVDTALKTDRYRLRGNVARKQPVHAGYPTVGGTLNIDWVESTFYDDFIAGNQIPLNMKWSGATDEIESGHTFEFEIDIPAIIFTGEAPTQDGDGFATQALPYEVVEPSSGDLFTINIKSTDTAL